MTWIEILEAVFPTWVELAVFVVVIDVITGVIVLLNCWLWRVHTIDEIDNERAESEAAKHTLRGAVRPVADPGPVAGTPGRVWPDAA